jgi:hypothetical protein
MAHSSASAFPRSLIPGIPCLTDCLPVWIGYAPAPKGETMRTILLIVLVLILIGALPTWPYSSGWGYYPSGGVGLILLILLVLVLAKRI